MRLGGGHLQRELNSTRNLLTPPAEYPDSLRNSGLRVRIRSLQVFNFKGFQDKALLCFREADYLFAEQLRQDIANGKLLEKRDGVVTDIRTVQGSHYMTRHEWEEFRKASWFVQSKVAKEIRQAELRWCNRAEIVARVAARPADLSRANQRLQGEVLHLQAESAQKQEAIANLTLQQQSQSELLTGLSQKLTDVRAQRAKDQAARERLRQDQQEEQRQHVAELEGLRRAFNSEANKMADASSGLQKKARAPQERTTTETRHPPCTLSAHSSSRPRAQRSSSSARTTRVLSAF